MLNNISGWDAANVGNSVEASVDQGRVTDELRNILGKALYEMSFAFDDDGIPTWEELSEDTWIRKSTWIKRAETIVRTYIVEIARQEREIAEKLKREKEGKHE